jgi:hypothetical protein
MNFLRHRVTRLEVAWDGLSLGVRVNLVLGLLALAAVVVLLIFTSARPRYVQLPEREATGASFQTTLLDLNPRIEDRAPCVPVCPSFAVYLPQTIQAAPVIASLRNPS